MVTELADPSLFREVLHMGKRHKAFSYEMVDLLKVSEKESFCTRVQTSRTFNSAVGMIRRLMLTRNKDTILNTILRLHKSLVKSQLCMCICVIA